MREQLRMQGRWRVGARIAAGLLLATAHAVAAAQCADLLSAARAMLGGPQFPLAWEETTMTDGRPLLVSLDERGGTLFVAFQKAGEGLWAQGPARLCRAGEAFEVRFAPQGLVTGPAIHWLARRGLENGAAIALRRMAANELQLDVMGWSGRFAAATAGGPGLWKP